MEILDPLTVGHIALPSGHVLDVLSVDEKYLKAPSLQNLIERYPATPVDSIDERHISFLEEDCRTSLPLKLTFANPDKILEM
jgi:hypothetical protein